MNILLIDIETRPSLAYVWSLWDDRVPLDRLIEEGEMICFAAKWLDDPVVHFKSTFHNGKPAMLRHAWDMFDRADAVMHYNGTRFDIPHLCREFVQAKMLPPSPYKQIDLLNTVKRRFRFVSNKLAHVAPALGLDGKVENGGFQLWLDCMAGNKKAWATMREYNVRDVTLLEELYHVLQPWILGHPHRGLYDGLDEGCCPSCGSDSTIRKGYAHTPTSTFQQYLCKDCGRWFRGTKSIERVGTRDVAA